MESNNTAPGIDEIGLCDIKTHFITIYPLLLQFFNCVRDSGLVPEQLKVSIVTPLYKKGYQKDLNNYRPIGNIPALANILEKND